MPIGIRLWSLFQQRLRLKMGCSVSVFEIFSATECVYAKDIPHCKYAQTPRLGLGTLIGLVFITVKNNRVYIFPES